MTQPEIVLAPIEEPPIDRRPLEIVERKGRGHPDTLCDRAAEALSVALSREYLARTGRIQHHNVDKGVLCAGAAAATYGGGRVLRPIRMIHVGRATTAVDGTAIDVDAIAAKATRTLIAEALRHLDPAQHLEIETRIRPTSADLAGLFARGTDIALANDTSIGCGYAPLSETERLVLDLEQHLTAPQTLVDHPHLGEDVKVLAVRTGDHIRLTVATAFVAAHVGTRQDYLDLKQALTHTVTEGAKALTHRSVEVRINAADDPARDQVYLTVTGTSAEAGDDGQVGRGNRANGLITPSRPMSLEALAGKNPVSHVGKLYNAWANRVAAGLAELPDVEEVTLELVSQIGAPITEPQALLLRVRGPALHDEEGLRRRLRDELDTLPDLWREIVDGRCRLF